MKICRSSREYVESEEIRSVVLVEPDYLQGYLIGEPQRYYLRFSIRRRGAASDSQFTRRSPASAFFLNIETPASYRFPVLLFFFQIKQYQRILAEPVMRKT